MDIDELNKIYQAYIQCGRSKRAAAKLLNISRTTYRRRLEKALILFADDKGKMPRIAFWDIETSHIFSAHYGMWNININKDNILHDWFIVCGAWKFRGEKKIHSVSLLDDMELFDKNSFDIRELHINDYHVVKVLYEFLQNVDILVHHNGDKFDMKKFNARAIYHGFKPLGKIQMVDTLKVARKHFSITSNSLDYLCTFFGIEGKLSNVRGTALNASLCKPDAIKAYEKYNRRDIWPSLENLYNKLLPYIDNHPNMNLFLDGEVCHKCGSRDVSEDETLEYTRTTVKIRYRCDKCGGLSVTNKTLKRAKIR